MLVRAHFAGPEGRPERHRLHRAQQRRKVVAHQHAHRPHRAGQGVGDARKDTSHQPLPHQRRLVSGRPARLRLRPHVEDRARRVLDAHHRLRAPLREDALPVRAGGHPPRTPEDRPAVHRDAGRKRHPLRHHLHQGRQALENPARKERGTVPDRTRPAVGGTAADVRLLVGKGRGARGDPRLHRRMSATELTPAVTQREETSRGYGMKTGPQRKSLTEC